MWLAVIRCGDENTAEFWQVAQWRLHGLFLQHSDNTQGELWLCRFLHHSLTWQWLRHTGMNTRTEVAGFTATPGKSWRRSSVVLPDYTFMLKEATSDVRDNVTLCVVCAVTDFRSVGCGGSVLTVVKVALTWIEGGRGSHPSISMVQTTPSDDSFILVTHKPLINQSILIIFPRASPGVCVCRHVHAFV